MDFHFRELILPINILNSAEKSSFFIGTD